MKKFNTIVLGCSGLIGIALSKLLKNNKTLFLSRTKPHNINKNWKKIDLDKDIKVLPKNIKTIFFLASPHYTINNLRKNNIYLKELKWLNKIIDSTKMKKFIYLSSSSIYLKNHKIGKVKKKCEKFLKKSNIPILQIWRPFNLVGVDQNKISDHFHNIPIKEIFFKKLNKLEFNGNENDIRGYSSVEKFCSIMLKKSNTIKSFTYDYGNPNGIKVSNIIKIFNKILKKKYNRDFVAIFKSNYPNKNVITKKKSVYSYYSKENSKKILDNYYRNLLNEKTRKVHYL